MLELQRSSLSPSLLVHFPAYATLILPSILPCLLDSSSPKHWVALEARLNTELVGLSLSEVFDFNGTAKLSSLVVKENYRRQGIGSHLFAFTQDLLVQEEHIRSLNLEYPQADPSTPPLERILTAQGWPPAKLYLIRCHFKMDNFNPPWLHYSYPLPSSLSFFSWKDLRPAEKDYIAYLAQQGRFLPHLSPFNREEWIDLDTSVGLRQGDLLVGWSITHRPDPSTLHYAILYVDSALLYSGYGIQLLVQSIQRHQQLPIPYALFEINLMEIDRSWWHFVKKRLLPIAHQVERIKWAIRVFI